MSGLSFTRKYRPSSFEDYLGEEVISLVKNRYKNKDNIPNVVMLQGTHGSGKTSMGRILAQVMQCLEPDEDGMPCGNCYMCEEIKTYITSADADSECEGLIEVNAAKTNGKDALTEIINDALIPPLHPTKYKIILLDECHEISHAAQNSLLKILEEPPKHLKFILCTTDPKDVLDTVKSRVNLNIEVKRKTVEEIVGKLLYICQQEQIKVSKEALELIAKKRNRIPRDCINLLDEVASAYGQVTIDAVQKHVGVDKAELYINYFDNANDSLGSILLFNQTLKERDIEPKEFIEGLIRFVLDACYIRNGVALSEYSPDMVTHIKKLFDHYKETEFDVLLHMLEEISNSIGAGETIGELLITTTAIKISKIGILTDSLKDSAEVSAKETKKSLKNRKDRLEAAKSTTLEGGENVKTASIATLTSYFTDAKLVDINVE